MLGVAYDFMNIGIFTLIIYVCWRVWKYINIIARLPPGPSGLPFVGIVNKLETLHVTETLQKWKDEHGDIYSFTLPGQSIVVVSGYDLIKEVLLTRSDDFAGRPESFRTKAIFNFHPEVAFSSDRPKVRALKKAMSTSLKMYGERLLKLEDISLAAIKEMVDEWKKFNGKPFDPQQSVHDVTSKIITSLVFGDYMTKKQFIENLYIQKKIVKLMAPGAKGQLLEFMPWLRYFGNQTWKGIIDVRTRLLDLYGLMLDNSKAKFDGKNPECVAHALMLSQKKLKEENGGMDVFSDKDVFNQTRVLIGAGTATTFRATHSFIAILTNNPQIQEHLQKEIEEAVGNRSPRLSDKEKMPYMEATVHELLRYISHIPILIPHTTMKDTVLGGYSLPKGTQVWVNAFGLHHDPRYWDEPWDFKPERFLDETGDLVTPDHINRRRLLPFGAGRRVCAGEVLAKNRMFLMMSGIVQNFTFKPKSEAEKPDHDPRHYLPGIATHPKDFEVCAIPRNI